MLVKKRTIKSAFRTRHVTFRYPPLFPLNPPPQHGARVFVSFPVLFFLYTIISSNLSPDSHTDRSVYRFLQKVFCQTGIQLFSSDERNICAPETQDFCWPQQSIERTGRRCFGNRDRCGRELPSLSWRNVSHSCWFKPTRWKTSHGKLEESRRESSLEEVCGSLSRGHELFIRETWCGG